MNEAEQKRAAKEFADFWKDKGYEKGQSQSFWLSLLHKVYGVEEPEKYITFEDQVHLDHTSFIDGYIADTKVLIEQKSLDKDLSKAIKQSDGMYLTPFQQAKRYITELPVSKHPRWVVTCNFGAFYVYDMEQPGGDPEIIYLKDLHKEYYRLSFLVDLENQHLKREMEVSIEAGNIVGEIYDAFSKQYANPDAIESMKSLNILCVRIVFCLYAEDAGLFGNHDMFHDYLAEYDTRGLRRALQDLFKVLDTKPEDRDPYLKDDNPILAAFPYVNGGLFSNEDIEIPPFTDEIKELLVKHASSDFDWSEISPTIFGAVFESTLNPETRRSGGMHYTSIENIHKLIDPLFLDDLKQELQDIKNIDIDRTRRKKLNEYREKLSKLKFLDPACGSGNFLTETYLSLRRLENEVINLLVNGQMAFGFENANPIKVSINQFYGIEINDFAATVAKTALWIAESQMMKETEEILLMNLDFLPLKSYTNIVEGNALRINWEDVIPRRELNYIMGNPPFVGHQMRNDQQVKDMSLAFYDLKKHGKLDYVCAWYNKAADYIKNSDILVAFVSTNSICQGESVGILWSFLIQKKMIEIQFAHQTFIWDSEANLKAHVHCVIIGFSYNSNNQKKKLYSAGRLNYVNHINGYLIAAPDVYIQSRGSCLTPGFPEMHKGSQATDGLGLILEPEEYIEFSKCYPSDLHLIRRYMGSYEFINRKERYCLWLNNVPPSEFKKNNFIMERLKRVSEFRKTSATASVRKYAETPSVFTQIRQPHEDYLAFPAMSSSRRRYMPIGYLSADIIASNQLYVLPKANMYMFGVLTSNVHMAWMRVVCGRLKSDYRYAPAIYNNFPWPNPTDKQRKKIEQTAKYILDVREVFQTSTLSDLYDELTMPPELRKAHQLNDKAVMEAYGITSRSEAFKSEAACVAMLMKMYRELSEK